MFTDLHITDFRGIQDLKLAGFSRVNLIVGENNTGKTTLLEALALCAAPQEAGTLLHRFRLSSGVSNPGRWLRRDGNQATFSHITLNGIQGHASVALTEKSVKCSEPPPFDEHDIAASIAMPNGSNFFEVPSPGHVRLWRDPQHPLLRIRTISVQHRTPQDLVVDFSTAVRSKQGEMELESLLHAVDDRIKAVRLDYEGDNRQPYISADIGLSERVPIAQLGQGVNRLIAIFCELLGQRPAICFIDEIENGLHHTVLRRIWQGIAEVAERLNIQVFVTTHSRECLEAAHRCFEERKIYDFRVVQLYRVREQIDGRVLDREHIAAAVESEIEVRG
jgi:ABC-type lipoprotein export system ATPase subunit